MNLLTRARKLSVSQQYTLIRAAVVLQVTCGICCSDVLSLYIIFLSVFSAFSLFSLFLLLFIIIFHVVSLFSSFFFFFIIGDRVCLYQIIDGWRLARKQLVRRTILSGTYIKSFFLVNYCSSFFGWILKNCSTSNSSVGGTI